MRGRHLCPAASPRVTRAALPRMTGLATLRPRHSGRVVPWAHEGGPPGPGDRPPRYPAAPGLTCLPTPSCVPLRPQRLARTSVFPRAGAL